MSDDDPRDLGQPITELERLAEDPAPGFVAGLRRRIERRRVTGQFADLVWHVPMIVLVEILDFIFQYFQAPGDRKGDPR